MVKKSAPEAPAKMANTIRIRQVKSRISCRREHREVLKTLGLRRIGHEVVREDTPAVRGAVAKIQYLLEIVEDRA